MENLAPVKQVYACMYMNNTYTYNDLIVNYDCWNAITYMQY